jgi:hypothetical protein
MKADAKSLGRLAARLDCKDSPERSEGETRGRVDAKLKFRKGDKCERPTTNIQRPTSKWRGEIRDEG